jgi:hypothetical protein
MAFIILYLPLQEVKIPYTWIQLVPFSSLWVITAIEMDQFLGRVSNTLLLQ